MNNSMQSVLNCNILYDTYSYQLVYHTDPAWFLHVNIRDLTKLTLFDTTCCTQT